MAGSHSEAPRTQSPDLEVISAILDVAGIDDVDDEGFSVAELLEQCPSQSLSSVQRKVRAAVSEGKLIRGYAMRMNGAGRKVRTAVYRKP